MNPRATILIPAAASLFFAGCQTTLIDRSDREVHRLIESRQRAALGRTADARIGHESGDIGERDSLYRFTPHPLDTTIVEPSASDAAPTDIEPSPTADTSSPAGNAERRVEEDDPVEAADAPTSEGGEPRRFGLRNALAYAMRHAREYQDAKEDLYLAALDLTLERHLWTPQFVASVRTDFADYGQVRDFDRAMSAVSDVSVSQRLPFGGEVSARVINSLMRDLGVHTTSGENGNFILAADIPLFRGAGRAAYESRYQAERDLIYAVRDFEQFRREFLVRVASDFFELQALKAGIANALQSYESRKADWEKADFINRMGQSDTIFDAPRARTSFRSAESQLVSAREQYASALDQFKIFIGMPIEEPLDVTSQDDDAESQALEDLLPRMSEEEAMALGLRYRLDLLNSLDRTDDSRRGVLVAKNRILPDLKLSGSAALDTDPTHLNSVSYHTERTTWRASLLLETNDRKAERNAYRASLVNLRRSEREHERLADTVRADVRRALRRIAQQEELRQIQRLNVEENELRSEAAKAQYDLGRTTNQDAVDAENDLLAARDDYAAAVARYRVAILEFHRDSGTLRVSDDGYWETPNAAADAPPP